MSLIYSAPWYKSYSIYLGYPIITLHLLISLVLEMDIESALKISSLPE